MHLFPEEVQKLLIERLSSSFSAERPYSDKVVNTIKDKFKEWDKYKIQIMHHYLKL